MEDKERRIGLIRPEIKRPGGVDVYVQNVIDFFRGIFGF